MPRTASGPIYILKEKLKFEEVGGFTVDQEKEDVFDVLQTKWLSHLETEARKYR